MARPAPSARTDSLEALPLFGQALVAARLARRAVLAMLNGSDRDTALAACDAIDAITRQGTGWGDDHPQMLALRGIRPTRATAAALDAVRWAFDSAGAAEAASDFPVDSTVTLSARRAIAAILSDRRVNAMQLGILLAADTDQIAFACSEVPIGKYTGLTNHVFGRLAPCHPLDLIEPRRTAQELAR